MVLVLGDPQAPFAAVMKLLAPELGADGMLRGELISIGDHFDYDLTDPETSRREGLRVLRWLAAHPAGQVKLLLGNHDAARVVELARVSDQEFAEARKLAFSIEATKKREGRAAAKRREREEFLPQFAISTPGIVARDYASFSVEQRDLVVELLHAGRFHLALTGELAGREILLTHAAVTEREVAQLGVAAHARPIADALQQLFTRAIATGLPLSLEPVSQPGAPGEEAGGLLAHRPSNPERPGADPKWELNPDRPRRFHPRELPIDLTQVAGHTNHPMCVKELAPWVTPRAAAARYAGIRTLRAGADITYDLGVLPPAAGVADLILIDGELRDPNNRAELLRIQAATL